MKHVILIAVFLCTAWLGQQAYAQQGFGTNAPDRSAAVDIVSTKRGLLIPRIDLTSTTLASPVANPHNSLLVYNKNTAGDVTPGFYYWEVTTGADHGAGKWVRFIDADDNSTTSVLAGQGINVISTPNPTNPNDTQYTVSVAPGASAERVLVTIEDPANPGQFITEWVTYAEFLTDLIAADNGLFYDPATGKIELGGALTRDTEIKTADKTLTFTVDAGGKIVIDGLTAMDPANIPAGATVAVMLADGTLQKYDLATLITGLTVTADNGLTMDPATNNIQLGGPLIRATEIDATGQTLAVKGLGNADAANKIVVANDGTGVLQTVERVLNYPIAANLDISNGAGYNQYAQEINVYATLPASGNIVVTLPPAVATGQVINVKITNENENHGGEVQILDGTNTLSYGALPYQGWILKSNGTNWMIVGRN